MKIYGLMWMEDSDNSASNRGGSGFRTAEMAQKKCFLLWRHYHGKSEEMREWAVAIGSVLISEQYN
jgi:hypothetical protein